MLSFSLVFDSALFAAHIFWVEMSVGWVELVFSACILICAMRLRNQFRCSSLYVQLFFNAPLIRSDCWQVSELEFSCFLFPWLSCLCLVFSWFHNLKLVSSWECSLRVKICELCCAVLWLYLIWWSTDVLFWWPGHVFLYLLFPLVMFKLDFYVLF